jgi:hypothetical protein
MNNTETQTTFITRNRRGNQEWIIQRHKQHWSQGTGQIKAFLIAPSVFSNVYLSSVLWSMLFVSLYYPFLIAPSVFSNFYLSSVLWSMHWSQDTGQINVRENRRGNQEWIIHCPFCFLWWMLFVSLYYPFLIAPSVFSNVYLSSVLWWMLFVSLYYPFQHWSQDTGQINVRKNRRGNQEWIIQRHKQHWSQDTGQIKVRENRRGNQEWIILVINVVCVSVLSIPDCPFCFL